MNKTLKYGRNGAIVGAAGFALHNLFIQFDNKESGIPFDWKSLFLSIFKGAAIGGAIGAGAGWITDHFNALEEPIDTDTALTMALAELRLNKNDTEYKLLHAKSEWLIDLLKQKYGSKLYKVPYRFGSTENGTALKEDFDIDICSPFTPDAFFSISDMFFSVFDTLKKYEGVNGIARVRDQKKSVGIYFIINGKEMKIDIVPQKLTKAKGKMTAGYLYINRNGLFEKPSRTKTDIAVLNSVNLTEVQNKILVTLKGWKKLNELPISSHLLKYLILEAYADNWGTIPKSFTRKIVMVLDYIQDNIEEITLSSVENTNNILTAISDYDKRKIAERCREIVSNYHYQPNSILNFIN